MEEPARFHFSQLFHNISIAAPRGRRNDVLVEWPGDKCNQGEEIHHGCDCAHRLRTMSCELELIGKFNICIHLGLLDLAQVASFETTPYECIAEPSDQRIAC